MATVYKTTPDTGIFSKFRWEDLRVTADVVQDGAIQGGPAPLRKKGIINSQRGSSYSGIVILNFKNYNYPFWQSCNFTSQISHGWHEGSNIEPHLHFMLAESDDIITSVNLFPPDALEVGRISSNTGGNIGAIDYYRSKVFIAVEGGLPYTVSYTGTISSTPRIYWYDEAQVFINFQVGATATSPINARYARFVLHDTTGLPTQVQFEQNDTATPYEPYSTTAFSPEVGQKLLLEFEYAWLNIGETVITTEIITINYTVTQADLDGRHFIIPFGQISKHNGEVSSMIWGRFSRIRKDDNWQYPIIGGETGIVNDNFEGDLYFLEWDYHYQINKTGTDVSYPDLL